MVMDADSTVRTDFLATALGLLEHDPDLVAVGGLFSGEGGGGLVGQLQRNEYVRYQRARRSPARSGLRAHRDRVGVPRLRAERRGRGPRLASSRGRPARCTTPSR